MAIDTTVIAAARASGGPSSTGASAACATGLLKKWKQKMNSVFAEMKVKNARAWW